MRWTDSGFEVPAGTRIASSDTAARPTAPADLRAPVPDLTAPLNRDAAPQRLHVVDTTMLFAPHSGGVKRYLLSKHAWIQQHAEFQHTIVTPGRISFGEPGDLVTVDWSLPLPGGYRLPVRRHLWQSRLKGLAPDIIEAGDPYLPAWAAVAAARDLGIPVVAFVHSDLPQIVGTHVGRWAERLLNAYVRSLYSRFDLVIAPSTVVAGRLRDIGVARVALQPLGVNTGQFHPRFRDPAVLRRFGLPDRKRLLVFAGRFSREKNIHRLVRAVGLLGDDYHLVLVGGRGPKRAFRSNRQVSVLPYQGSSLPALLASCDVLVHAGEQETFGLIVIEAMASGLPVVAVRAGALADIVRPEFGVLVSPGDARSIADGVIEVFGRGRDLLGTAARDHAVTHYELHDIVRELLDRYVDLAARKHS